MMTIEEKAKAYDDALKRAKNLENTTVEEDFLIGYIFPQLKEIEDDESGDEKIRKALLRCCDDWDKGQFGCMAKEDVPAIRAYLERMKEQKSEIKYIYPIFKVGDTIKPKAYNESHRIDKIKNDTYVLDNGFTFPIVDQDVWEIVEQNPAEWSEEDEKMLRTIISDGSRCVELDSKQIDWLKSLRPQPHWKPSEEQMKALLELEKTYVLEHEVTQETAWMYKVIKSLREQLSELRKGEL